MKRYKIKIGKATWHTHPTIFGYWSTIENEKEIQKYTYLHARLILYLMKREGIKAKMVELPQKQKHSKNVILLKNHEWNGTPEGKKTITKIIKKCKEKNIKSNHVATFHDTYMAFYYFTALSAFVGKAWATKTLVYFLMPVQLCAWYCFGENTLKIIENKLKKKKTKR